MLVNVDPCFGNSVNAVEVFSVAQVAGESNWRITFPFSAMVRRFIFRFSFRH
jgi:hypothetical protein